MCNFAVSRQPAAALAPVGAGASADAVSDDKDLTDLVYTGRTHNIRSAVVSRRPFLMTSSVP